MRSPIIPSLKGLVSKNASPFFVLFLSQVKRNAENFILSTKTLGNSVHVCFSIKTNPHPQILRTLAAARVGMEAVSLRELQQMSSFSCKKIFNSPASSEAEIREALKQKCIIVIDNISQARLVHSISKGKSLEVGIRVRMDCHRFGFDPVEINSAIMELRDLNLRVSLLHAHPGTNQSLQDYQKFLLRLKELMADLPQLHALDLGGGFPGNESLRARKVSLSDYMQLIRETLGDNLKGKEIFFEVGRNLVEDAMGLVAQVQHTKVLGQNHYALLDAGINVLPKVSFAPFHFSALNETGSSKYNYFLCGPSMFGNDEFGRVFAALERGDVVLVENVGAYCTELAWKLSRDIPPIVVIKK